MLNWLKKDRCNLCKDERAVRFCLRKNKDIGWLCCNELRINGKCPAPCVYTPITVDSSSSVLPKIKVDSGTEMNDYLHKFLHLWIYTPNAELDNLSPQQLCQTDNGRQKFSSWLLKYDHHDMTALRILNRILNLALPYGENDGGFEKTAEEFLNILITQDWQALLPFFPQADIRLELNLIPYLLEKLQTTDLLTKVKHWQLVNAGFSEDKKEGFTFCEVNQKYNLTLLFCLENGCWKISQLICGTIQDFYAQKQIYENLAVSLSQEKIQQSSDLLEKAAAFYPLSADLAYYKGLYYMLQKDYSTAKTHFSFAAAREPKWREPIFQLSLLLLNDKDYSAAVIWLQYLRELYPADTLILNNLGVCYLGLEQKDKAREIWQSALEIEPDSGIIKKNLEHLQNG